MSVIPLVMAAVEPVWIENPGAPDASSGPDWLLVTLMAPAALALLYGVAWLVLRGRDRRAHDDGERAFRALSRRMGLARSQREFLRRLAQRSGIPGVALLLSEGAFMQAERKADCQTDEATLRRVRTVLFAGGAPADSRG